MTASVSRQASIEKPQSWPSEREEQGEMDQQQHQRRKTILDVARARGWITLGEIIKLASHSPVDTDEAIDIAREVGIQVDDHGDEPAWDDLSTLAEESPGAFTAGARRAPPAEELGADSPAAIYIREINRTPLLTADEEIRLAQEREAGVEAAARLAAGVDDPAERDHLEATLRVAESARAHLIEANLRLVVSVARKYIGRGVSFLDLVQEGNIGLQRGVEKYDWRRGFRFSTYAYWWIRQAVTRAVAEQSRTIRLPVHVVEQLSKLYTTARTLQVQLGREPTPEEIAATLGIAPNRVREALAAARIPISLDSPIGEDGNATIADLIADADALAPAEEAEEEIFAAELLAALGEYLTPREVDVLRLRFGLGGGQTRTLMEVGDELGVSRERARQLEAEAMQKLKRATPHLEQFHRFAR
jgi:RNA polymerase primary sigma factor